MHFCLNLKCQRFKFAFSNIGFGCDHPISCNRMVASLTTTVANDYNIITSTAMECSRLQGLLKDIEQHTKRAKIITRELHVRGNNLARLAVLTSHIDEVLRTSGEDFDSDDN